MEAEGFAVGSELWLGQTIHTNVAVLARSFCIIPSVFNKAVAAVAEGVARPRRQREVAPVW